MKRTKTAAGPKRFLSLSLFRRAHQAISQSDSQGHELVALKSYLDQNHVPLKMNIEISEQLWNKKHAGMLADEIFR